MSKKILILFVLFLPFIFLSAQQILEVQFTPAEVESMLFLYNKTTVKGSEVEIVVPVGVKLRSGLKKARALKDTTKSITLELTPTDVQVCLNIIQNSTFDALYAELVLGMKQKLIKLLPPPSTQPKPQKGRK